MVTYVDTQAGGVNNDLTQGGTFEWPLNLGTEFYLNVANNLIPGQGSGQNVTFKVQDIRGSETFTVLYGRSISQPVKGHLVSTVPATLPSSPNADLHIVLSDSPVDLSVQQQQLSTSTGTGTVEPQVTFPTNSQFVFYTVPATLKAILLSAIVNTPDKWQLFVRSLAGTAYVYDYLNAVVTGVGTLGQGAGNTAQLNPPKQLNPNDEIGITDSSVGGSGGTASLVIQLVPL